MNLRNKLSVMVLTVLMLLVVACGGSGQTTEPATPEATHTPLPIGSVAPEATHTPLPTANDTSAALETLTPTPQSPKGTAATLQNVTLAETVHRPADSVQCETYESGQCAELRWQPVTGLRTGVVGALAISPSDPDVVYAGFDSNDMSLWRSDDAGTTWTHVDSTAHVSGIAVSPTDANIVIHSVIEGDVIYSSKWGVESVIPLSRRGTENPRFSAIAYAPRHPNIVYTSASGRREGAGQREGDSAEFFSSFDGGQTWSLAGTCVACGVTYSIQVDPTDPSTVWVGSTTGVRASYDGGSTWTTNLLAGVAGDRSQVLGLAFHPEKPIRLLAATAEDGVYRSNDGGQVWVQSNIGLGTDRIHAVAFAPNNPEVVYLTTHLGIYRSDDGGSTWEPRSNGLGYQFVHAIAIDPRDSDIAYVGTASELHTLHPTHKQQGLHRGEGIYKTLDGGRTWALSDAGIEEDNLVVMTPHPRLPFELWTGATAGRGGFTTTDAGDSWLFSANIAAHYPMVFAYSHSFPTVQYLSSLYVSNELVRSTDNGVTWHSLTTGLQQGVSETSREKGLFDPNKRWHVHTHGLAVAPSDSNIVYAGTISHPTTREQYNLDGAHIFKSSNGGNTFEEVDNGFPTETQTSINAIVIHPTDPNIVYVMTSRFESVKAIGVYKTVNGGQLWQPVNNGLDLETNDLQIDPADPETLYAAARGGVYKSVDGGTSWKLSSNGLLGGEVKDLAIDPVNPLILYAATYNGVFRTKNGGEIWYPVNLDLPIIGSGRVGGFDHDRVLEVDATGKVVYAIIRATDKDRFAGRLLYRAVLGTPDPVIYEFEVNGETINVQSTSHISNLFVDLVDREIRFTVAGPVGTVSRTTVTVPKKVLSELTSAIVDGKDLSVQIAGTSVSFEFPHNGQRQVTIR